MNLLAGQSVLVTGGAGSFGTAFVKRLLAMQPGPSRIVVFSRDEHKHSVLRRDCHDDYRLRFMLGDVRDLQRLRLAFHGVDTVVHAASLKEIPAGEYDPSEFIRTIVNGAENVVNAALEQGVKRCLLLSTDKSCSPATLYGSAKLCAERLFSAANAYSGKAGTMFASTRYGNVLSSAESVVPLFRSYVAQAKPLPVTDPEMSRYIMTMDQAVDFVLLALNRMRGGEVFIPKLPSVRVSTIAEAVAGKGYPLKVIGLRAGEKRHESLVSKDEAPQTLDFGDHYRILPAYPWKEIDRSGRPVGVDFTYASDTNACWLSVDEFRGLIEKAA